MRAYVCVYVKLSPILSVLQYREKVGAFASSHFRMHKKLFAEVAPFTRNIQQSAPQQSMSINETAESNFINTILLKEKKEK